MVIAVVVSRDNAAGKKEISRLTALVSSQKELKNEGVNMLPEDFRALMEAFEVEKEAFIQNLSQKDPILSGKLNEVLNSIPSPRAKAPEAEKPSPSVPVAAKTPKPAHESAPVKIDPDKSTPDRITSYASLYPDLYVKENMDKTRLKYMDDKNHIYITFDDGPSRHTPNILNYLKKNNIPATFFVIPNKNSKAILNQIQDAGHAIGIHSASHDYKAIYSSVEAFLGDFKKAYDMIYEQTGSKPQFFRFPGGSKNGHNADVRGDIVAEMARRGFVFFDWNVDSKDAEGANWTQMYNTVLSEVAVNTSKTSSHRSIILFHDWNGGYNTVLVIDDVIKALKSDPHGYVFGKIDLNVRPLNFYN